LLTGAASATGADSTTGAAASATGAAAGACSVVAVFTSEASSVLLQADNNANVTSPAAIISLDVIVFSCFYYNLSYFNCLNYVKTKKIVSHYYLNFHLSRFYAFNT
jgi:hypothetical protein